MSLKKKYLKSKPVCKVTFEIPGNLVKGAKDVALVGEFNNWDVNETKMRKVKSGAFTRTLDLDAGREYQYRYLVDGKRWINDPKADRFIPAGFGAEENCVVEV